MVDTNVIVTFTRTENGVQKTITHLNSEAEPQGNFLMIYESGMPRKTTVYPLSDVLKYEHVKAN